MKICIACGKRKPLSKYYRHPQMADGHLGRCKECQKENTRAARAARLAYYQEYDRKRANLPKRVAARAAYKETIEGRERMRAGQYAWMQRNPKKRAAHIIVGNAIRGGRLTKQPCEICGNPITHAHHDDYSDPLSVRWFCRQHHIEQHKASK